MTARKAKKAEPKAVADMTEEERYAAGVKMLEARDPIKAIMEALRATMGKEIEKQWNRTSAFYEAINKNLQKKSAP